MSQLKDLIVNGTTRFNGTVESDQPFKGNLDGNAATASKINSAIRTNVGNNKRGKYYFIGSYTTTETSWQSFNSKIAVYDNVNNDVRAEIFMRLRHHGADNIWKDKSIKVIASTTAANFYLIEISTTEMQLWCQITNSDFWEPRVVTIYGDILNFTDTPSAVYDSLPEGTITPAEYDIQQHTAYGTCSTASATAEKAVTVSSKYWDMTAGSIITVKFTNTNTAQNPTLNINGTGALPIIYNVSAISTTNLMYAGSANRYITYVYTGTAFVFIGWSIDNSTGYNDATTSKSGLMSAADKTKLDGIDVMKGSSATNDGSAGLVPIPIAGSQDQFLRADGSWSTPPGKEYNDATESSNGLMSAKDKTKLNRLNIDYGTCDTSSANPSKIVTLTDNPEWKPTEGSIIIVKFANDNTAANPTLNVNNTGAKPILYGANSVASTHIWTAGEANEYTQYLYNGEQYVWISHSSDLFNTYNVMTGATNESEGTSGLVPTPVAGDQDKFLKANGNWANIANSLTVTLTTGKWTNSSQTVSAPGVTANSIVIVAPIPDNQDAYSNCGIKCVSQSKGFLTFSYAKTPDSDIAVNVVIF